MYVSKLSIEDIKEKVLRTREKPRGLVLQPFAPCPRCGGTVDMSAEGLFCHSCDTRWVLSKN